MSAKKTSTGKVTATKKTPVKKAPPKKKAVAKKQVKNDSIPLMSSESVASTRSRRNASSTITRTDRYRNIDEGLIPFKFSAGANYKSKSDLDVRDAVELCQKAYYNFATFRNTIDLMTEFSVNSIYFKGGSKKSRSFFEAFFKKINLWSFQDKFFREYYRSGNVFLYRFDAKLKSKDLRKISQTFGFSSSAASVSIPSKYIILNPADVRLTGTASFASGSYTKVVTDYELQRLKNPQTDEEKEVAKTLSPKVKEQLKGGSKVILIPLKQEKTVAIFYKKQDYEPFAVPMGYPVLEDLNAKAELKKMDMAIARTMQQAILLITMGAPPEEGGVDQKNLEAMQTLFANESIGRVLISDYTTEANFVLPNIGNLLDPKKYEVLDRDIRIGLNNILMGENEKFANSSIKTKIFIERLKQARETFVNEFLMPEIKRISKEIGLKNYPTPFFDDIDLRDSLEFARIYTRLIELGILTPEEGMEAIELGRLPDEESSVEHQAEYKKLKDKGYYEPMMGGPDTQKKLTKLKSDEAVKLKQVPQPTSLPSAKPQGKENGRPPGTGRPKTRNSVGPIRTSTPIKAEESYSFEGVKDNMLLAQELKAEVEKELRKKHKIKRLNKEQKNVAEQISELIIANEEPEDWKGHVDIYTVKPIDQNKQRVNAIHEVASEHQVDFYLASLLYASRKRD